MHLKSLRQNGGHLASSFLKTICNVKHVNAVKTCFLNRIIIWAVMLTQSAFFVYISNLIIIAHAYFYNSKAY